MERSIQAIDELEDALEEVNKAIPNISISPKKKDFDNAVKERVASTNSASIANTNSTKKRNPTPAKPSTSIMQAKSKTAPTQATKKPFAAPPKPTLARASTVKASAASSRDSNVKAKAQSHAEIVDYLATKRRPVSVSFPTPPPVAKSTKPATKATFQLPGEAIAAKLKAAREERLRKEQEEAEKKRQFKARPAPKTIGTAPVVKETKASKARESIAIADTTNGSGATSKRTSIIGISGAGKRQSTIVSSRPSSIYGRLSTNPSAAGATKVRPATSTTKPAFTTSLESKPQTTKPAVTVKTTVSSADIASQRLKGKEVFNRDKLEKEERERQQREKEEAAKRARAEAAEKGRQASREWARKQKERLALQEQSKNKGPASTVASS
jgi:hypothetical protein